MIGMLISTYRVRLDPGVFFSPKIERFLAGSYDDDLDTAELTVLIDEKDQNYRKYCIKAVRNGDLVDKDALYVGSFFEEVYQEFVHIFIT